MATSSRQRLAGYVQRWRRERYPNLEAAIRAAGVNRQTWERVERGERVWDRSLRLIEAALHWQPGDADAVMAGGEPAPQAASSSELSPLPVDLAVLRDIVDNPRMTDRQKVSIIRTLLDDWRHDETADQQLQEDAPAAARA